MSREGDWICAACQHFNFKKRDSCQQCCCPKYAAEAQVAAYAAALMHKTHMLAGDWYCGVSNCGAHNYASRTSCYCCKAFKDLYGHGAAAMVAHGYATNVPGWKPGDWICTRCNTHNYASRIECYKCKTPKFESGGAI